MINIPWRVVLEASAKVLGVCLAMRMASVDIARAGPPFVTDDPQPTDLHHWEIYNFVEGARGRADTEGEAGLDLNYGGFKDTQLTATLPLAYRSGDKGGAGAADVELAVKYRLLHQGPGGFRLDVSVFPRVFLPTARRGFGSGDVGLLLPVWAEKDVGAWSFFGGGGYQLNPGAGARNFWVSGLALQRTLTPRLSAGVEVYSHTRDAVDGRAFTGLNLGALYKLSQHWSLIGSGGPGLQSARTEGRYDFYVALKADY